ncbi:MAG: acetyltransferase [Ignavibacteriales bacterium]|nr:acetyltransferase [Ignavibacteriales bacterium]
MLLYGASGHAKVVIDCLESQNINITAIFDDDLNKKALLSYDVIGKYSEHLFPDDEIIISIGDNGIRKKVSEVIKHKFGNARHISASVSKNVNIGLGTVIFHKSILQSSVQVGKHVIINTAASIDHDCIIEDFVHISPNATLCGNVSVGEGTHIGAGAVIIPNIKIGKWAMVGAGSIVTKDVPDYSVVVGNPARKIKTINK